MGEKIAWEKFYHSFTMTYRPAITEIMRGELRDNLRLFQTQLEERIEELHDELRAKLAGGVDSLTLAALKKECEDRDLAVSGTKGKLFERLQGYLDGTVKPKKKRRRR